jgi:sugar O-acyltransferase (sialic acid O-acetyltransferase NeuD family)
MNRHNLQSKPWVLLGAGGHANVVLALLRELQCEVVCVSDPSLLAQSVPVWQGLPVFDDATLLAQHSPTNVFLANGVGFVQTPEPRQRVFNTYAQMGFVFPALVHPFTWVAKDALVGEGVQIMAGAVVQAGTQLGANTLVNTGARIDHGCQIGPHCHVACGAILCGTVHLGTHTFIGAGAVVIQGISLGDHCTVGAGSVVLHSHGNHQRLVGSPARVIPYTPKGTTT